MSFKLIKETDEHEREKIIERTIQNYPTELIDMVHGYVKSQVIFVAHKYKMFDVIDNNGGCPSAAVLAKALDMDADNLSRFLQVCTGLGLMSRSVATDGTVQFNNTDLSKKFLMSTSEHYMGSFLDFHALEYFTVTSIGDKVKTGARGENGHDLSLTSCGQQELERIMGVHPEQYLQASIRYNDWQMRMAVDALINMFDFSAFKTVVDIGGSGGVLAQGLVRAHPNVEVIILDLPHVVQQARAKIDAEVDSTRWRNIHFQAGNVLEKIDVPRGDVIVTAHTLNVLTSSELDTALCNIYAALPPGGIFISYDRQLEDDRCRPLLVGLTDLRIMVFCEGKERSTQEYVELLNKHGFIDITARRHSPHIMYDMITAIKPDIM